MILDIYACRMYTDKWSSQGIFSYAKILNPCLVVTSTLFIIFKLHQKVHTKESENTQQLNRIQCINGLLYNTKEESNKQ